MSTLSKICRGSGAVALLALLVAANAAQASVNGPINRSGPNIMYLGVTENATKFPGPMPPSLFMPNAWTSPPAAPGTQTPPQVLGDDLVFNPGLNFNADAVNGGAAGADGFLSMTIMTANPADHINKLDINEGGGYMVGGAGSYVEASLVAGVPDFAGGLFITKINDAIDVNIKVNPVITFATVPPGVVIDGNKVRFNANSSGAWSGKAAYDIDAALAAAGYAGQRATKLNLSLDDILFASAGPQGFAHIDKKVFIIDPNIVPEPSTIVLGLLGGLGLAVTARRCRKVKSEALAA